MSDARWSSRRQRLRSPSQGLLCATRPKYSQVRIIWHGGARTDYTDGVHKTMLVAAKDSAYPRVQCIFSGPPSMYTTVSRRLYRRWVERLSSSVGGTMFILVGEVTASVFKKREAAAVNHRPAAYLAPGIRHLKN